MNSSRMFFEESTNHRTRDRFSLLEMSAGSSAKMEKILLALISASSIEHEGTRSFFTQTLETDLQPEKFTHNMFFIKFWKTPHFFQSLFNNALVPP